MTSNSYRSFHGRSLGEILDQNRGVGLGFDVLRLGLALMILMSHASGIIGHGGLKTEVINWIFGIDAETASHLARATAPTGISPDDHAVTGLGRPITIALVPMFFALSGFLVSGSAARTKTLVQFLGLRVLRIVPALAVEVFLSALVLGTIFTTLPLKDYFTHPGFWAYWLNIIGEVHFYLPGVFENTSSSTKVNSNLWTLPFELVCYITISVFIALGLIKAPKKLLWLTVAATVALAIANAVYGFQVTNKHLPGLVVVYYFVVGVLFYQFRYQIKFSLVYFLACIAISYPLMMFTRTIYFYPVFLTYITVFIGLFPFPQFKLLKSGDYSYGIYLYGYPVTQGLVAGFPVLKESIVATVGLTFLGTCLLAAFSWHAVEKHCLKLKKYISPRSAKLEVDHHPGVAEQPDGEAAPASDGGRPLATGS